MRDTINRNALMVIALWGIMYFTNYTFAEPDYDATIKKELAELRQRIDYLEKRLAESNTTSITQAEEKKLAETFPNAKKPILANLNMELYGFVYGQASYDSKQTNDKDGPTYPVPQSGNSDDSSQFSGTVKATRLGVKISGPEISSWQTGGVIEGDFWGDSEISHGSLKPRLRHGYIECKYDTCGILVGQTADLIGNITPAVLNFNGLAQSGVIGNRHFQAKVSKTIEIEKSRSFLIESAISRPEHSHSGTPHLQYNLAYLSPVFCEKESKFSFSGVLGREKVALNGSGTLSERYKVWGINAAMNVPVTQYVAFTLSAFTGANLSMYDGGIGQGVNTTLRKAIRTQGGFAQLTFTPVKKWEWNLGYGIDTTKDSDLNNYNTANPPGASRKKNENYFTNLKYLWTESFWVGLEVSHMKISYKGIERRDKNNRVELGMCYCF